MPDTITDDRAAEIAAMTVPDLTEALNGLDLPSIEAVLRAEEARGDAVRSTAIAAITTAIAALGSSDPEQPPSTAPYAPPVDTTGVIFSTGRQLQVDDQGVLNVPADLTDNELRQLIATGFEPI